LLIGVNNQYQGININTYRPDFVQLLNRAIEIAGGDARRVFVLSIPDYSYTPSHANVAGISEAIDRYNDINRQVTNENNVAYFDITAISRQGLEKPEYVAFDGLHPSGIQYGEWVKLILPRISLVSGSVNIADHSEDSIQWSNYNGSLYLYLPESGGDLSIFDSTGREVKRVAVFDDFIQISSGQMNPGIYLLKYMNEDRTYSGKIVLI
jgi:hypothetical protein